MDWGWVAALIAWLNDNQGVTTVLIPIVGALFLSVQYAALGRNPDAPTYGHPQPLADSATRLRSLLETTLSSRRRAKSSSITIGHLGFAFDYLPLFVAYRQGLLRDLTGESDVRLVKFDSFAAMDEAIHNQEVQFVALSSVPATRLRCTGAPLHAIEMLSAHAQCIISPWPNISVLRDLADAKIATVQFTSSHFGALLALEAAGMDATDERFVFVDEKEGRELVRQRLVSGWAIWPLHSDYEVEVTEAREVIGSEVPIYSVLASVGHLSDRSLFLSRALRERIRKAKSWIIDHEEQAIRYAKREFGVPHRVVRAAWRRFAFGAQLTEKTQSDFQKNADLMKKHGWFDEDEASRLSDFIRMI